MNIDITKYDHRLKASWDQFVTDSKNGTFLLFRDYMEYHADRFTDSSLLFYRDSALIAIMPANLADGVLLSHGGLTYGGIVSDYRMKTPVMLELFDALVEYLKLIGVGKLMYKVVPHIYHALPAEEDLYALFRHDARLVRRDVSSTIPGSGPVKLSKGRKWAIKKGEASGLQISRSFDFENFMRLMAAALQTRYGTRPTHTAAEMELLAGRFPENIKLFAAFKDDAMHAGVIMYETAKVAHTQYIATSEDGKKSYALDFLLDHLINHYKAKDYFDFGISTEEQGRFLNVGLITQKEEFGARALAYDTYEVDI